MQLLLKCTFISIRDLPDIRQLKQDFRPNTGYQTKVGYTVASLENIFIFVAAGSGAPVFPTSTPAMPATAVGQYLEVLKERNLLRYFIYDL